MCGSARKVEAVSTAKRPTAPTFFAGALRIT